MLRDQVKISNWKIQVHLYNFSSNLALEMTINQLSLVKYQQKGKLKLKNSVDFILLKAKGCSYSFTHKSIQEFQVSKYILSFLSSLNTQKLDSLYNKDRMNLSKDIYKEKLKSVENIKNILIYIVQLSCDNQFINASSNSIYLLNYLNIYPDYQILVNLIIKYKFIRFQFLFYRLKQLQIFKYQHKFMQFQLFQFNKCHLDNQEVKLVQYQPNGELIASVGADGIIKL
ncbi:unnamed protein product [Paramecium sonneborni]|uniref:Uncharacterized protein n=1 Tax=Paramecium sonneborni TaxID=65129 RepID=A0A8S1RSV1_9CILI|nr:unnamed protein product [Paramecium sonneborni]